MIERPFASGSTATEILETVLAKGTGEVLKPLEGLCRCARKARRPDVASNCPVEDAGVLFERILGNAFEHGLCGPPVQLPSLPTDWVAC